MTITHVNVQLLTGNLFDGWPDTTGVDEAASARRYADMLTARLCAAFPSAEIDVDVQHASGYERAPYVTSDVEDTWVEERDALDVIDDIESTLYQEIGTKGDDAYVWIVPATQGHAR